VNWSNVEKGHISLLRGGVGAPIKQMPRYLSFGAPGEVEQLSKPEQVSDLPPLRRLLAVALRLFDRRSAPSSKEGIGPPFKFHQLLSNFINSFQDFVNLSQLLASTPVIDRRSSAVIGSA